MDTLVSHYKLTLQGIPALFLTAAVFSCLLLQLVALAITVFVFCFHFRLVLESSGRWGFVPA